MNTYLGAAQNLSSSDVVADEIAAAAITYLEGYLWDPKDAKEAFRKAAKIAHDAGRAVALTLSDSFCVDRYRAEFLALLRDRVVDLVFANEVGIEEPLRDRRFRHRARQLAEGRQARAWSPAARRGPWSWTAARPKPVPVFPVERVVDATGAGDLFAAGFLHGFARGLPHKASAQLGALAAAEVISHMGARPLRKLSDLARENGASFRGAAKPRANITSVATSQPVVRSRPCGPRPE